MKTELTSSTPPAPAAGSGFWTSPALKTQSLSYPPRFRGRVPMRIQMACDVSPDWPSSGQTARKDAIYDAWTNSYGAVAAIFPDGSKLGVKPQEFDVVEWYTPGTQPSNPPSTTPVA